MPLFPLNLLRRITRLCICLSLVLCTIYSTATAKEPEPKGRNPKLPDWNAEAPKPHPITPPTQKQIDAALGKGIDFLLKRQNKDGSWGSARNTKDLNIFAPAPGGHHAFRMGVTSLCIMAMIEFQEDNLHAKDGTRKAAVDKSLDRAEAWIMVNLPKLRRANPAAIYNVWGHSYAISALVRMTRRHADDVKLTEKYSKLIQDQIKLLNRYHCINGGWGYYDMVAHTKQPSGSPTCFTTATALVALSEVKSLNIDVPEKMIQGAISSINRQRKPDFSYLYGEYLKANPMYVINRPGGSLGRSQACNLALRLYGEKEVTDTVLKTWLDRLYARNGWLSIGRKRPVPHESHFAVAGYFYYYGHFYAALCIDQLPVKDRPHYQDHLAHILLPLQEKDGCWWDYPLYDYHQQYGTAMAIMSILRCQKPARNMLRE